MFNSRSIIIPKYFTLLLGLTSVLPIIIGRKYLKLLGIFNSTVLDLLSNNLLAISQRLIAFAHSDNSLNILLLLFDTSSCSSSSSSFELTFELKKFIFLNNE